MKLFKYLLFVITIIILILPLFQNVFSVIPESPFYGAIIVPSKPVFSTQSILSGVYQEQLIQFAEHKIGFRNSLVKLNNQIAFSLFNFTHSKNIVVGKDQYLFEKGYIYEYTGKSFYGKEFWNEKIRIIKSVQEALKLKGTDILIVMAPGKATFFPEFIPDRFHPRKKYITNTNFLPAFFMENEINFIDFSHYFVSIKDTARYPLFPQCGIHWSSYGAYIAMDSIIHYIEKLKSRKMINIRMNSVEIPEDLRHADYDLGNLMNLFFTIPHYKMAYPKVSYHSYSDAYIPKVLIIGDSFYWTLFEYGSNVYRHQRFWCYFNKEYTEDNLTGTELNRNNLKDEILSQDMIIILYTDAGFNNLGSGFFEETYKMLFGKL